MAKINKTNRPVTIVGYVDPVDEDDAESGIIISTEDDEEYLVEMNRQGRRLLDLIGEKVRAQGVVTQTDDGESRISVMKLEVIEYEETHQDDAYDEPDDYFDRYDD